MIRASQQCALANLLREGYCSLEKRPLRGFDLTDAERKASTGLTVEAHRLLVGLSDCDRVAISRDPEWLPSMLQEVITAGVDVIVGDPVVLGGGLHARRVSLHPDIIAQL